MHPTRLTIFCFYNSTGTVHSYVLKLLSDLRTVSDRILFVANGQLSEEGRALVSSYTEEIHVRENLGLDYGAYRYALKDILGESVYAYDELILCNDTFFGFFEPLDGIFDHMSSKDLDLWGMNLVDRNILGHIQSFFLDIKLRNKEFIEDAFSEEIRTNDYFICEPYIEPRLLYLAKIRGLSYGAYANSNFSDIYSNPMSCLEKYRLPILKKKSLDPTMCDAKELENALEWIDKNTDYPIGYIRECRAELYPEDNKKTSVDGKVMSFGDTPESTFLEWAEEGDFYIYGAGLLGKGLYYTYFKDNEKFQGYVVSNKANNPEGCFLISELPQDARVIIGVKANSQQAVIEKIPASMQIISLWKE